MVKLFFAFLITSAVGSVLATILAAARPVTKRIFSASWHYYMWLSVLIVMMLPLTVKLPHIATMVSDTAEIIVSVPKMHENSLSESDFGGVSDNSDKIAAVTEKIGNVLSENTEKFAYLWLFAAMVLFSVKLIAYALFRIKIYRNSTVAAHMSMQCYTSVKIKTRVCDSISSPLVTGLFKSLLLLPNVEFTDVQTENILAHEMTHVRRKDILYKWFLTVVKCVHWFNPVIYLVARQVNIDCEISCDLAVVKDMDKEQERNYVETILSLISRGGKGFPLTTGMTGGKELLKLRFFNIRNRKNIAKRTNIISAVIAVGVLISALLANGVIADTVNQNKVIERKDIADGAVGMIERANPILAMSESVKIPAEINETRAVSESITSNAQTEKNLTRQALVKASYEPKEDTSSEEVVFGFEALSAENSNSKGVQNGVNFDSENNYKIGEYSYKTGLSNSESGIKCDEDGNISVYFDTNVDNIVKISFYESDTHENVGDYEILAGEESIYTFSGFDDDSTYDVSINGRIESDWKIEGEYIIY